jgi:hypothetical protein
MIDFTGHITCTSEFHRMFLSYLEEFQLNQQQYSFRTSASVGVFRDNGSFYLYFYYFIQQFLQQLQDLESLEVDSFDMLQATLYYHPLVNTNAKPTMINREVDEKQTELTRIPEGDERETLDVNESADHVPIQGSFHESQQLQKQLEFLKLIYKVDRKFSNSNSSLSNYFKFLITDDHYFPSESIGKILYYISKLQYFPLSSFPTDLTQNVDEEVHITFGCDPNRITIFFEELADLSSQQRSLLYRIPRKCFKVFPRCIYRCFKSIILSETVRSKLFWLAVIACSFDILYLLNQMDSHNRLGDSFLEMSNERAGYVDVLFHQYSICTLILFVIVEVFLFKWLGYCFVLSFVASSLCIGSFFVWGSWVN